MEDSACNACMEYGILMAEIREERPRITEHAPAISKGPTPMNDTNTKKPSTEELARNLWDRHSIARAYLLEAICEHGNDELRDHIGLGVDLENIEGQYIETEEQADFYDLPVGSRKDFAGGWYWFQVDKALYDALKERGECVFADDFGGYYWNRYTVGQVCWADAVIEEIAEAWWNESHASQGAAVVA